MSQQVKVFMHPTLKMAGRSCQSCKLKKRRCTRELPACSLCLRRRRRCLYEQGEQAEHQPLVSSTETYNQLYNLPARSNNFPAAIFLDPLLSNHGGLTIPRPYVSFSPNVGDILGDFTSKKAIADEYFGTIHGWMPIISRTRLYGSLMGLSQHTDPDAILVLLGMKLITSHPVDRNFHSKLYTLMKESLLKMEMIGYVSVYTIQSAILTALYEVGHAIYPAALTTISACARYAVALGITQAFSIPGSRWVEQEERNRLWWAILMLDRITNIPLNGRHLCTPDPDAASVLPVDDDDWDKGILSTDMSRTLSSPPDLKTGRFARLAQAINLLSQVLRYISNIESRVQLSLSDMVQMDRTLFALERLIEIEEAQRNMVFCCSIAICYNALLLIHTVVLADKLNASSKENQVTSNLSLQSTLTNTLRNSRRFRNGDWGSIDDTSPLALDWIYRSITTLMSLSPKAEFCDVSQSIITLRETLGVIGERWHAASVYLSLIETREAVGMS